MKQTATLICRSAAVLVAGDREATHGDKHENFKNIAFIWNAILAMKLPAIIEDPLSPLDVANLLEGLKIARRYTGTHNLDDYVDGAGYAGCAGEIAEKMHPGAPSCPGTERVSIETGVIAESVEQKPPTDRRHSLNEKEP
jgi:hypothetical protein